MLAVKQINSRTRWCKQEFYISFILCFLNCGYGGRSESGYSEASMADQAKSRWEDAEAAEAYRKLAEERINSEVQTLRPEDIRDLMSADERARRLAEAERLERELEAELGE